MTAERLIRLLRDPEQLSSVTYEELKTLSLAYPFSAHLKQLLLLKSEQINHHEYNRNLAAAATYSIDRAYLHRILAPAVVKVKEEVLQLKPIQTVLRDLEAIQPLEKGQEMAAAVVREETPTILVPPVVTAPKEPDFQDLMEKTDELPVPEPMPEMEAEKVEDTLVITEISAPPVPEITITPLVAETVIQPEPVPVPPEMEPESRPFSEWITQFKLPPLPPPPARRKPETPVEMPFPAEEDSEDEPKEKPAKTANTTGPPRVAQSLAEKSVAEKEDVRSETLAKVLALQGYKDKAIAMYEKLMLDFPEKSPNFAAAIEELKKIKV